MKNSHQTHKTHQSKKKKAGVSTYLQCLLINPAYVLEMNLKYLTWCPSGDDSDWQDQRRPLLVGTVCLSYSAAGVFQLTLSFFIIIFFIPCEMYTTF